MSRNKKLLLRMLTAWLFHVCSVSPRRRETTCWRPVPRRRHHPSSPPSWQPSNQQCAMTRRRLGEATSTSLCRTPMDPVQSTPSMCFLHCFRYYSGVSSPAYTWKNKRGGSNNGCPLLLRDGLNVQNTEYDCIRQMQILLHCARFQLNN